MVKIGIEEIINILEEEASERTYFRVIECINTHLTSMSTGMRNSCNSRYCPYCSDRIKTKEKNEITKKLEKIEESDYFLLTLNGREVTEGELKREIESNNGAFNKLIRLKLLSDIVVGYAKATEISYKKGLFKPHIHSVLIFKKSYHNRFNLKKERMLIEKNWNKYKGSNKLEIDIQGVRSIERVISYLTVSNKKKYMKMQPQEYRGIIKAIKDKKRLYSYGGVLSKKQTKK